MNAPWWKKPVMRMDLRISSPTWMIGCCLVQLDIALKLLFHWKETSGCLKSTRLFPNYCHPSCFAVLRASHAKPWADCVNDAERLDVFNGFLLSANLDALFDRCLITFDDTGKIIISTRLTQDQCDTLGLKPGLCLRWIANEHLFYLRYHRSLFVV